MYKNKTIALIVALFALCMCSCSEEDGGESEFGNWKERNETYFNTVYSRAKNSTTGTWRAYTSWSLESQAAADADDHIVVEVLNEGKGTVSPLYSDSVTVHYRGNLMPTNSYPDGYQFATSWYGEYNPSVMIPTGSRVKNFINGFTTALMKMHEGDRWRVYIPAALGYKDDNTKSEIPAYSTLVFDITLVSIKETD